MEKFNRKFVKLIDEKEINNYYEYLFKVFEKEYLCLSNRQIIEEVSKNSIFSKKESIFLKMIVVNGFSNKKLYKIKPLGKHKIEHPIELINYMVNEGYTPSTPFIRWVHKKFGIRWNPIYWFIFMMRDIAPVDLISIREDLKTCKNKELPQTLELYYRLGTGLEKLNIHPDLGVRMIMKTEFKDDKKYKGFNPVDYLDYYYGGLDEEDMTIAETFYNILVNHRKELPLKSKVLIVGNGPVPDEAHALAMIPEIDMIIPSDIDLRNIKIMQLHTGSKNPLASQKIRPGEEHSDFINYLFEKRSGSKYGLFAVREITAVKAQNPVYIDISKKNPLKLSKNKLSIQKLKADLIVVPFCPESITDNLKTYSLYIKNISTLVKSNRFLCMLALKNAKFYFSGTKKLKAVPIDESIIFEELNKNGFADIEVITIKTGLNPQKRGFSDSMVIWARKK